MDFDEYFISEAYLAAMKSKDTSTQVGAVVVGPDMEIRSKGYNGPCRGEDDDNLEIYERPLKNFIFEHAERNALYNMARVGIPAKGCKMYTTWGPPCVDCARAIIQSGIKEVICHAENPGSSSTRWADSMKVSFDLLQRCGVGFRMWSGDISNFKIKCDGKPFDPSKSRQR